MENRGSLIVLLVFLSVNLLINLVFEHCAFHKHVQNINEEGYLLPTIARKITCRRFD